MLKMFLFAFCLGLILFSNFVSATWWNETWTNKRNITISNSSIVINPYRVVLNCSQILGASCPQTITEIRIVNDTGDEISFAFEDDGDGNFESGENITFSITLGSTSPVYEVYYNNNTAVAYGNSSLYSIGWDDDFEDNDVTDWDTAPYIVNSPAYDSYAGMGNGTKSPADDDNFGSIYNPAKIIIYVRATNSGAENQVRFGEGASKRIDLELGSGNVFRYDGGSGWTSTGTTATADIWYRWIIYADFSADTFDWWLWNETDKIDQLICNDCSFTTAGNYINKINIWGGQAGGGNLYFDNLFINYDTTMTTSVGSEETRYSGDPPYIDFYETSNTTYWIIDDDFHFKGHDSDTPNNIHVKIYVDTNLVYENEGYNAESDILVSGISDYLTVGAHYFKGWANDTDGNTNETYVYFTIADYNETSINYTTPVNETSEQEFSIRYRYNDDLINNITSVLYWDSSLAGLFSQNSNSTHITNIINYDIPLVSSNNTAHNFYFTTNITYENGTSYLINSTANDQYVFHGYWVNDIVTDKSDYYLETENVITTLNITDILGNATITVNITTDTNSEIITDYTTEDNIRTYTTTNNLGSNTANSESKYIYANVTFSFNGSSREDSNQTSVTSYKMLLTNCSAGSGSEVETLRFFIKDEADTSDLNGSLSYTLKVFKNKDVFVRNYSFEENSVYNDTVCIYPVWASYYTDGQINYLADGYGQRSYFLYNASISNTSQDIDLYLLNESDTTLVNIYVEDQYGVPVEDVYVKIQKYYVSTDNYLTIAIPRTDFEGHTVSYLNLYDTYYRFILEQDGEVLRTFEPLILTSNIVTLPLESVTYGKYWDYYGSIAHSCSWNNDTQYFSCTLTDTSGVMNSYGLDMWELGIIAETQICNDTSTTASTTLTCYLGNSTANSFRYILYAENGVTAVLESGILQISAVEDLYGLAGVVASIFIIMILALMGSSNPVLMAFLTGMGVVFSTAIGFLAIEWSAISGLMIAIAIVIYKMRS